MKGVEILNKTNVMIYNDKLVVFGFMFLGLSLILGCLATSKKIKKDVTRNILFFGFALCLILATVIVFTYKSVKIPSGRYQYEAIIQDDVSINEVYKHYNVIDKKGKKWILEDKNE